MADREIEREIERQTHWTVRPRRVLGYLPFAVGNVRERVWSPWTALRMVVTCWRAEPSWTLLRALRKRRLELIRGE